MLSVAFAELPALLPPKHDYVTANCTFRRLIFCIVHLSCKLKCTFSKKMRNTKAEREKKKSWYLAVITIITAHSQDTSRSVGMSSSRGGSSSSSSFTQWLTFAMLAHTRTHTHSQIQMIQHADVNVYHIQYLG